jgi:hypothetical protein
MVYLEVLNWQRSNAKQFNQRTDFFCSSALSFWWGFLSQYSCLYIIKLDAVSQRLANEQHVNKEFEIDTY